MEPFKYGTERWEVIVHVLLQGACTFLGAFWTVVAYQVRFSVNTIIWRTTLTYSSYLGTVLYLSVLYQYQVRNAASRYRGQWPLSADCMSGYSLV